MNKQDLIDALTAAGVDFDPSATVPVLKALLDAHNDTLGGNDTTAEPDESMVPKTTTSIGEVLGYDLATSGDSMRLELELADGTNRVFYVGLPYHTASNLALWVVPGAIVSVTTALHIKNKTSYKKNGEWFYHGASMQSNESINFSNIRRTTNRTWQELLDNHNKVEKPLTRAELKAESKAMFNELGSDAIVLSQIMANMAALSK